jgi:ubiquinone/menaquinone biosynthesis C-methylase UbiE
MSVTSFATEAERSYTRFAAAYVRGRRPDLDGGSDEEAMARGVEAGLRLHRFKRARVLPRISRVLGTLRGIDPCSLLDVGTGRGVFLWPLLEAFPSLPVTCVDVDPERVRQLDCVAAGGISNLCARVSDVTALPFDDHAFDVVTALEVLEHVGRTKEAVRQIVRVSRRFVLVTVPSHADDNPLHVHTFTAEVLRREFLEAGAARVEVEGVLNHLVLTVRTS